MGRLFNETGKLISEQTEITGVNITNFKELAWMWTSLLCSQAYPITNAKAYVFSDSLLCVGKWEMILLQKGRRCSIYAESTRCLETRRRLVLKDGFSKIQESAQSWTYKFAVMKINTLLKFWSNLCFKTEPLLGLESCMALNEYVTESMLTKEEVDIASGKPLLKQDHDKNQQ